MDIIHCPNFHEPVVTDKECIYCDATMRKTFDKATRIGHDMLNCNLCVLKEERWL